jgi:hypothetical protein
VKSVFPSAQIVENRVDKYPIKVIISAEIGGQKMEVWSGRQQDLFRKNASQRSKSIQMITSSLKDLKEDFDLE